VRQLPAPGQTGAFLAVTAGAGALHAVRLALAGALLVGGAVGAGAALGAGGGFALLSLPAGLLAAAAAAYLAGVLLPFSRSRPRLALRRLAMAVDRVALRTVLRAARVVGDKTDPILRSFVQANNAAVRALYRRRKPEKVMVLLPHCVVWTRCPKKVVKDLASCTECDLCQMEEVLGIADRTSLPVGIAIRSAEAYSQARGMGPDLTLAVACDDRLVKGISRVPELPAFGLPLHLPKESCHDNLVDLSGLHAAMAYFLGPERMAGRAPAREPGWSLPRQAAASRRVRLPALPAGKAAPGPVAGSPAGAPAPRA
jgi:hypothetical protein